MYRFLFRFAVTVLTILTANLLTSAITDLMVSFKYNYKPISFTLAGMAIIVIIFYPLFLKLEGWLTVVSAKMVRSGSSMAGKYLGLAMSFFLGILILSYFYAKIWYGINIFSLIIKGNLAEYF